MNQGLILGVAWLELAFFVALLLWFILRRT
jgi:hypothetical protein